MKTTVINIPAERITDWETFHDVFQETLGFFERYGRNSNAWIDCMTNVDDPEGGLTAVTVKSGDLLALRIDGTEDFKRRCPEQYEALIDFVAFVNYRRVEVGEAPVLALLLLTRTVHSDLESIDS